MKAKVDGHKSSCSQRSFALSTLLMCSKHCQLIDGLSVFAALPVCIFIATDRQVNEGGGMAADSGRNICCFGDIPGLISEAHEEEQQEGEAKV